MKVGKLSLTQEHTFDDMEIEILEKEVNLVKLFSPEHGIRGDIQAGEKVSDYTDEKTGLPVCTLYGAKKIPTEEMLADLDVMVFDIQDVGSRLYTYLYSMSYSMQACGKYGKEFVVMDRPNPVGGTASHSLPVRTDHWRGSQAVSGRIRGGL